MQRNVQLSWHFGSGKNSRAGAQVHDVLNVILPLQNSSTSLHLAIKHVNAETRVILNHFLYVNYNFRKANFVVHIGGPFCVSPLHFFHPRLLFLFLGLEMVLIPHLCNFVALFVCEFFTIQTTLRESQEALGHCPILP